MQINELGIKCIPHCGISSVCSAQTPPPLFWVNIFVIGQYTITWLNLPLSGVDTLQSVFLPGLGLDLAVGQPVLGVLVG